MDRARRVQKNYLRVLLAATIMLAFLAGCGVHKPFEFMDENTQVKKGSLAVISGDPSEPTERLAEYLTHELKQKSRFNVMSQEQIGRKIGKYPVVINRQVPENEDKPVWLAKGEKSKLNSMQARLKTDYLLVVWISDLSRITTTYSTGGGKVTYSATVLGNLVEYPKAEPIGFSICGYSKDQTCCLFGKSEGDDINELLKYSGQEIAEKFMSVTKSAK